MKPLSPCTEARGLPCKQWGQRGSLQHGLEKLGLTGTTSPMAMKAQGCMTWHVQNPMYRDTEAQQVHHPH